MSAYPCSENTYNGWRNWATWNTYNILSGYEDMYERVLYIARESKDIDYFRETLKQDIEENMLEHIEYSFKSDSTLGQLFDTAMTVYLDSINWEEIARAFWEDIEQDEDEDEEGEG